VPTAGTVIGGDQITVGDISATAVAAGKGAKALVNNIDTYIQQYSERALTEAEEAEQARRMEQERLAQAVKTHIQRLDHQADGTHRAPGSANPYKYVHAYEVSDADRFAGRAEVTERLLHKLVCADSRCRLVVLDGQARIGKTSLLRAGIVPTLMGAEHLPLYIQIPPSTKKPIATIIKESLLPELGATPLLARAPLRAFIRQVTDLLPEGKRLFLLLDRFEAVMTLSGDAHDAFREELAACLFDDNPREHWLISLDAAYTSEINQLFQPTIPYPLANTLKVPALTGKEAREAILEPAKRYGLQFSEELVDLMVADLGGDSIDPSYLQVLCFALVEALPADAKSLNIDNYLKQGGATGVLGAFLDQTMQHLPVALQEAGWQTLYALLDEQDGKATKAALTSKLRLEGVPESETQRALELMRANGLLRQQEEEFLLATEHFEARIRAWGREWMAQRAVSEQIRSEIRRQAQHIASSALRGLAGGAVGFGLAYWLAFVGQDVDFIGLTTLFRALPGALAGSIAILAADIGLVAGTDGRNRWLPWLAGGGGGAAGFALAMANHFLFISPAAFSDSAMALLLSLLGPTFEGAVWGLVTGLGTVWLLRGPRDWRSVIPKLLATAALASGTVWLFEERLLEIRAFAYPEPPITLLAVGFVMPLCVMLATLLPFLQLGRRGESEGG
jgi:hypothetical protein